MCRLLLLPNNLILRLLLRWCSLERCRALASCHRLAQTTWLVLSTGNIIDELMMRVWRCQLRYCIHLLAIVQFYVEVVDIHADGSNIIYVTHKVACRVAVRRRYADLRKLRFGLCSQLVGEHLLIALSLEAARHGMIVEIVEGKIHQLLISAALGRVGTNLL